MSSCILFILILIHEKKITKVNVSYGISSEYKKATRERKHILNPPIIFFLVKLLGANDNCQETLER